MSIASEIERISGNIADAYTALNGKGATMPAIQNSANLADTIDTITTGGGGGGEDLSFLSAPFEGFKSGGTFPTYVSATTAASNGWVNLTENSLYLTYMYGILFDDCTPNVIYVDKNYASIYVPEGAVCQKDTSDTSNYCWSVDFTNCTKKYICLGYQNYPFNSPNIRIHHGNLSSTWNGRLTTEFINKLYINTANTTTYTWNDAFLDWCGFMYSPNATPPIVGDNLTITRLTDGSTISLTTSNVYNYFPTSTRAELKDWYAAMGNDLNTITFSCPADFLEDKWEIISRHINLPCKIDFSGVSASSATFYPFRYTRIKEMFIKLPSWKIDFTSESYRSDKTQQFVLSIATMSKESIQYMVQNAPTVTNKTFVIGSNATNYLNGYDATLITTLTSKGWTVT